jgi:SAM-dependent methyltransferase/DNA-binding HxlR family transcriptional regulator
MPSFTPRALLSLLFNGSKAIDVVQASLEIGLLAALERGPARLDLLAEELGVVPLRLYKLLDCLETLGLVSRTHEGETLGETSYRLVEPLRATAAAVVGPESQERDRDRHPWRAIHGRLTEVLRGEHAMPDDVFPWPPTSEDQLASFEQSMSAGCAPIIESFVATSERLFAPLAGSPRTRWLDVGGGDGTLARGILPRVGHVDADVFNLPALRPLVERVRTPRVGFVAGDFLREALPAGYDVLSFVRVLHDWPNEVATMLMNKAFDAVRPGGRIVVSEEMRNGERLAIQFFWSYFLVGLDNCVSRLREATYYVEILTRAGFVDCQVIPGPFDVIVATRPPVGA